MKTKFLNTIIVLIAVLMLPLACSAKEGYYNGIKLCGRVKIVDTFPDIRVKVVDYLPDLRVKQVDSFPRDIGEWQFVDSFPDFTIQFVDNFPDLEIQFVEHFPGVR